MENTNNGVSPAPPERVKQTKYLSSRAGGSLGHCRLNPCAASGRLFTGNRQGTFSPEDVVYTPRLTYGIGGFVNPAVFEQEIKDIHFTAKQTVIAHFVLDPVLPEGAQADRLSVINYRKYFTPIEKPPVYNQFNVLQVRFLINILIVDNNLSG